MGNYISEHWHGQHSMMRSLAINTIALNILLVSLIGYFTSWLESHSVASDAVIFIAAIAFWLVLLSWQAVGSFRVASKRIRNYGSVSNYYIVLAVVLGCGLFTLASVATQYGANIDYRQNAVDEYRAPEPTYKLTLNANALTLTGDIGYGATRELQAQLNNSPQLTTLKLDSAGGLITEARGMANLVEEYNLNTHAQNQCFSACTIVFISGEQRSLGKDSNLGFHQYNVESKSPTPWIKPKEEEAKDLSYFQAQGIPDWFMQKAYSTPHDSIWTPSVDTLLSAGVITTTNNMSLH